MTQPHKPPTGPIAKSPSALLLVRNDFCRADGWFDPRVMNCARALLGDGWQVVVVCDQNGPQPGSETLDGLTIFRGLWHRDCAKQAPTRLVRRLPLISLLNHQFCLDSLPVVWRSLAGQPVDLVLSNDVEMLPLGRVLAKRKRARLVYDSHEYHASRASNVIPRQLKGRLRTLTYKVVEKWLVPKAHLVTTVSESIAQRLHADHPRLKTRVRVIHNYPPLPLAEKNDFIRRRYHLPPERKIIIYVGGLQVGRGCETLVRLAPRLPGSTVFFLGDGPLRAELEQMASGLPPDKVIFHGAVPQKQVGPITASADIGACLISPGSVSHQMAAPNKIFIYMQAGIPSVDSDFPEMLRLVDEAGLGICVSPWTTKPL